MGYKEICIGLGVFIFVCVFLFAYFFIKKYKNRKKKFQKKIKKILIKIKNLPDTHNNQKILEYDKVLDMCLSEKFPNMKNKTTGEKMKKYGKSRDGFIDEDQIWSAHKLRNTIAHTIGFQVSYKKFLKAEKSFLREISGLLQ